jgi:hypothetical protein
MATQNLYLTSSQPRHPRRGRSDCGRRITVEDIAIWHLRLGKTVADSRTTTSLAAFMPRSRTDHQAEIERGISENDAFLRGAQQFSNSPNTGEGVVASAIVDGASEMQSYGLRQRGVDVTVTEAGMRGGMTKLNSRSP